MGTSTRAVARTFASEPQPSKNTGQKLLNNTVFKSGKTHSLTLLLQNHLDHFNNLLQDPWYRKNARPPVLSPDAWKRLAPRFPPRSLTLAHPRPNKILHALPWHMPHTVQDLQHMVWKIRCTRRT